MLGVRHSFRRGAPPPPPLPGVRACAVPPLLSEERRPAWVGHRGCRRANQRAWAWMARTTRVLPPSVCLIGIACHSLARASDTQSQTHKTLSQLGCHTIPSDSSKSVRQTLLSSQGHARPLSPPRTHGAKGTNNSRNSNRRQGTRRVRLAQTAAPLSTRVTSAISPAARHGRDYVWL